MTIQTFKNEELNDTMFSIENQEEWKQIAAELDMGSQLKFMEQSKSLMPYPFINKSMENIFETLCPRKEEYKAYSKTPIPLEVMKELAFCVGEKYFDTLEVWYDDKTPDPFLIGVNNKCYVNYNEGGKGGAWKQSEKIFATEDQAKNWAETMGHYVTSTGTTSDRYLVVRWADELRPITELKALAKERLMEKYAQEWRLKKEEMEQKIKNCADLVGQFLNGEIDTWSLRA